MRQAAETGLAATPHVRPKTAAADEPLAERSDAAILDLGDPDALRAILEGHTTVLQLIGTMRHRFHTGDTYETSDIATTRHLVAAARETPDVDHLILLSAVGTGTPVGAYLKAKARAEAEVLGSGLPTTILRPSSFEGGGHRPPPGMGPILGLVGRLGLRRTAARFRPIAVPDLARTLLGIARERAPLDAILEGVSLWAAVERHTAEANEAGPP